MAEKFDVAYAIAACLDHIDYNGVVINKDNYKQYEETAKKALTKKGVLYITYQQQKYAISWASGHLIQLKQAQDYNPDYKQWRNMPLPFFPDKYETMIKRKIDPAKMRVLDEPNPYCVAQLKLLKQLFERSEYIINATDDDREGEAIFGYIYEYLGVNVPYKRLIQSELTTAGLQKSMASLKSAESTKNKESAGRMRAIADWTVGSNLTAAMTLKYSSGSVISIGRVQTAVLNMIVTRELEIKNFISKPFWNIVGDFTTQAGDKYKGKLQLEEPFSDKSKANELLHILNEKCPVATITEYDQKPTTKEVPLLYNLPSLQVDAAKKFGFSAQKVLDIVQALYMGGYTTYPRTESSVLNDAETVNVDKSLDMLCKYNSAYSKWINNVPKAQRNYTKRHFNSKKVKSHTAIVTTDKQPENLSAEQEKVYDLIAKSVIRTIYKPAACEKTTIITQVNNYKFKTTGLVIKDPQWLIVDAMEDESEDKEENDVLPQLQVNDKVAGKYETQEGKTKSPQRYNDATIIVAMSTAGKKVKDEEIKQYMAEAEHPGLGTGATMAAIVETLVRRNYIERSSEKKKTYFVPTQKGINLIKILPVEDIKSVTLTAKWEHRLYNISNGEENTEAFLNDIKEATTKWVEEIKSSRQQISLDDAETSQNYNCPFCGKKVRKTKFGYICTGYKKDDPQSCKFGLSYSFFDITLNDKDIIDLITKRKTDRTFLRKKKDGSCYKAFLTLKDDHKIGVSFETDYNCPKCNSKMNISKSGWLCSKYKNGCDFALWDSYKSGINLTDTDKANLLKGKKTRLIKGLKSKKGTTFDTYLVLKNGELAFSFPKTKKDK